MKPKVIIQYVDANNKIIDWPVLYPARWYNQVSDLEVLPNVKRILAVFNVSFK